MALKEEKVLVTSKKNKASVRRKTSALSGMRVMIVHQNRHRKPLHPLSHPCHEVEVCRRTEYPRLKQTWCHSSTTVQILFESTCTRSPSEYWHSPECQFCKTESECKAGDKCLFPHHKVYEQPNKKAKERLLFPPKKRKRRQECCGYCENCTTIGLRLPDAKSWDRYEEHDSLSLRYVKQVSEKIKDHRLEKYKSKILISEVPTP